MKRNPETLNLAMDYAAAMEACAAYVAVKNPAVRDPETAYRLLRPVMTAATSGDAQECFMVILLDTKNRVIGSRAMSPTKKSRRFAPRSRPSPAASVR